MGCAGSWGWECWRGWDLQKKKQTRADDDAPADHHGGPGESKYKAVVQRKFQEPIKALSEDETLSPTKWKDQWSRIQF